MHKLNKKTGRQAVRFPLYMGSLGRVDFPMAHMVTGKSVVLFVEPHEYDQYMKAHGDSLHVHRLRSSGGGFGRLCNAMLEHAHRSGHEHYAFCDDDVFEFTRRGNRPVDLNHWFESSVAIMKQNHLAQLMMSFAAHNWYETDRQLKEKIGAWCVLVNDVAQVRAVGGYDEGLEIFNDWDLSAKLMSYGRRTACWYEYMFKHRMASMDGGAADIYRNQRTELAIDILTARYGTDCIRRVRAHGQIEPRFKWSKIKRRREPGAVD